jgi:type III secretion protein V
VSRTHVAPRVLRRAAGALPAAANGLNALLQGRSTGEALFALSVLAIVLLLVTPLAPWALDLLLAVSLAAAATLLATTLLAREPVRFASFPALLLLTTLFRLALEVGSTRLVLSRGAAGRVIDAFGRVVVQGNPVVGAVIFVILTLVQLLVVAKGAERVAEVAARFTLDALPGKQMSIDAELRAGTLDAAEARRRRRSLERESQLYGAMDGALKFVKGDALAGVVIVLVNAAGGIAAGALRGLALGEAARRSLLLAIGDGLAAQLPSLLVSAAAAVAVTRVASEEEGVGLGAEVCRQLTAEPAALAAVAVLLGALAVAPGFPAVPFLLPAAALALAAWRASRGTRGAPARAAPSPPAQDALGLPAPIILELAPDLLAAMDPGSPALTPEGVSTLRADLWQRMGVRLPPVAIRPSAGPPGSFALLLDEVPLVQGRAVGEEVAVLAPPDELALVGIPARAGTDPLTGHPLSLVAAGEAARAAALGALRRAPERALAEVCGALRRHAHQLVGVQEVQVLLDGLEPLSPALVREVARQLPAPVLAEVLRRLLEEGVSIRPLRAILEAILEAGGAARGAASLAESCRRALRRQLGHAHAGEGALAVVLLDPAAEQAIREGLEGELAALDPRLAMALIDALAAELSAQPSPPVLVTSPDVRRAVRGLVAPRFPRLAVLAYEELPPELAVRPVGRVGMGAAGEGLDGLPGLASSGASG